MTEEVTEKPAAGSTGDGSTGSVVMERTLDAPTELVWRMWTEAEHFAAWYGPTGATVPAIEMDVRVGGRRHLCMEVPTPSGTHRMWFVGRYREVDDGRRLVYTESLSDPEGNVVPPAEVGMPGDHPEVTEITVELEDLGDRTRMVVTHAGVPADSPGAAGWSMALDDLTEYLAGLVEQT